MPDVYRAPEVILRMKWDYKVDVWSLRDGDKSILQINKYALQWDLNIWDLFKGYRLFRTRNTEKLLDDSIHLADMIAVLGSPPVDFLDRGTKSLKFFNEDCKWLGRAPIPDRSLESLEERLDFLRFMRRMLCWRPKDRATPAELFADPWIQEGFEPKAKPV
ncbi:MAG: hypothetical protein MMC23_000223 [Stictis urceolatum]|nr:hypothetical protein [Stictis urceolata]